MAGMPAIYRYEKIHTLTGSGYEIDDWWNAWKIPDGSYRHENTRGIIGYTVN